jgi:hypothetical protein
MADRCRGEIRANVIQHGDLERIVMLVLEVGLTEPDIGRKIDAVLGLGTVDADQEHAAGPLEFESLLI